MRIPISWLGEYVDLPTDVSVDSVHAALVKVGLEEEGSHSFGVSGPVVVGKVLEFVDEPQSNGKTIRWCQVQVGPNETDVRGIVCGAHNFLVGDKVVVTLPGAVLPGPFPIAARKTYGHVSDGMIASQKELGLGDEHGGILRLTELGLDPEPGTDAIALLGLADEAVEVNVTPDRGYAFSIRGIAREYSNSTGAAFRDPALLPSLPIETAAGFQVTIDDQQPIRGRVGASVFVTRVVRNIDVTRPTPPWMTGRLSLVGVRSISLPVDITNYVMFELGQPIHAYDLATLTGGITVRRAATGEKLETLDGQTRTLDSEDLVIADESGAIGLAGVMGGAATEISSTTTDVLIEAANFDPVSIARTAKRHRLPSEASKRFERGVDPKVADAAAARVVQLLVELAGGVVDPLGSHHASTQEPSAIELPDGFVEGLIGVEFTPEEVRWALTEVGAGIEESSGSLLVTPPTWRPDITDRAALAEEVARLVGYDRIPSVLPIAPPGRGLTRAQKLRRSAAQSLAANGSTEVLAFPFVSQKSNDIFGASTGTAAAIKLANPLDVDASYLRTSLLPGLIDIARRNRSRGIVDLNIFEIGTVFTPAAGVLYGTDQVPPIAALPTESVLKELEAGIPPQPRHAAVVITGASVSKQPGQAAIAASWQDALTAMQQLAASLRVPLEIRQGSHQAFHPGRCAELFVLTPDGAGATSVGFAGELLPSLAASVDLPRVVAAAEIDLDALITASGEPHVAPIRSFPAATQDLSLIVSVEVPAADVLDAVREGAGQLLESIRIVDDYRGAGLAADTKSLTFALRFRAADRTLTAAEASESKNAGVAVAAARFGAQLRD